METIDQIYGIKDFLEKSIQTIGHMNKREIDSNLDQLDSILMRHYKKGYSYIYKKNAIQNQIRKMIHMPEEAGKLGRLREDYKRLLTAMREEINSLGVPGRNDVKIDSYDKVHRERPQKARSSSEPLTDAILKTIEDQMSSAQWKELINLMKKVKNREEPKFKIQEKFKNFGLEECSSILANIVTNPSVIVAF